MTGRKSDLSEAELDVLKALWDFQAATVRELHERLAAQGRQWAYTTVLTFLTRLEAKGYVASEKSALAHVFRPVVSREKLLRQKLVDLAHELCDGTATPLLQALVAGKQFSAQEIQSFRQLIDDLEHEPAAKPASPKSKRKR